MGKRPAAFASSLVPKVGFRLAGFGQLLPFPEILPIQMRFNMMR